MIITESLTFISNIPFKVITLITTKMVQIFSKETVMNPTGGDSLGRSVMSLPGSPRSNNSVPVVGSAESLVTRVRKLSVT